MNSNETTDSETTIDDATHTEHCRIAGCQHPAIHESGTQGWCALCRAVAFGDDPMVPPQTAVTVRANIERLLADAHRIGAEVDEPGPEHHNVSIAARLAEDLLDLLERAPETDVYVNHPSLGSAPIAIAACLANCIASIEPF